MSNCDNTNDNTERNNDKYKYFNKCYLEEIDHPFEKYLSYMNKVYGNIVNKYNNYNAYCK